MVVVVAGAGGWPQVLFFIQAGLPAALRFFSNYCDFPTL